MLKFVILIVNFLSLSLEETPCKRLIDCPIVLSSLKLDHKEPDYCIPDDMVKCPEIEMSKSMRKCLEYSLKVFKESDEGDEPIDSCKVTAIPFILGGTNALPGEFPHIAAIGHRDDDRNVKLICGGSVLTHKFVITSAYCVELREVNLARIGPKDYRIDKTIPHPEFVKGRYYHDIALVQLKKSIVFSPVIRPICLPLPDTTINESQSLTAVGWNSKDDRILQKVELEPFSYEECRDLYEGQKGLEGGISSTTHLCYGDKKERHKDTCAGDAGGPLLKHNSDVYCSYTLIGITSAGVGCKNNYPGLYTNVKPYLGWIESIIWNKTE